jgi:orotate phosphoribosyltransferase
MQQYKKDFIQLLVKAGALKFGEFTLKSGRVAPYFLNAGSFYTGELASELGKFYAAALEDSGIDYDVIFGPAYKGIPLSVITTTALYSEQGKNSAYCFNRKEAKDHGAAKGKVLVGAPLDADTRIVIVDDVITAGTAIRETVDLLKENGNPQIAGVLIAMNRMEKNNDGVNALAQIEEALGCPVLSIVDLDDVLEVLGPELGEEQMEVIRLYREEYGV